MSIHYPHSTVPVPSPCDCRRTRNAPVHWRMDFLEKIRKLVKDNEEEFSQDEVAMTTFCRRCKSIAEVSAGMAGLVDPSSIMGALQEQST